MEGGWKDGDLEYVELRRVATGALNFGVGHGVISFFYKGQAKGDTIEAMCGAPTAGSVGSQCKGSIKYYAEGVSRKCGQNHSGAAEAMWIRIYPDQFKDKQDLLGEDASPSSVRWTCADVKRLLTKNTNAVSWLPSAEQIEEHLRDAKQESVKVLQQFTSHANIFTDDEFGWEEEDRAGAETMGRWVFDSSESYVALLRAIDCSFQPMHFSPALANGAGHGHHHHGHQHVGESDRDHGWIIETLRSSDGEPYVVINFPGHHRAIATDEFKDAEEEHTLLSREVQTMITEATRLENQENQQLVRVFAPTRPGQPPVRTTVADRAQNLRDEAAALQVDEPNNKGALTLVKEEIERLVKTKQHKVWRHLVHASLLNDEVIRLNKISGATPDFKMISNNCQDLCLDLYVLLTGLARPTYYDRKKLAALAGVAGVVAVGGCCTTAGCGVAACAGAVTCSVCCAAGVATAGVCGCVACCMGSQYCEAGALARCGPCRGERAAPSRCFPNCLAPQP